MVSTWIYTAGINKRNSWRGYLRKIQYFRCFVCTCSGNQYRKKCFFVESENQKKLVDSKPERVLFLSGRDSIEDTLIRKLRKNDANLENVYAMNVTDKKFSKLKFTGVYLEQLLQEYHPTLCIFDPMQDFLSNGVKMNVKNAVRNCIAPLVGLGEKYGTAFLIVVHTDNQCPIPGRKKISNSADIWNIGRSVLRVGETEEKNINYIAHEKSDYGQLCKTVLYRVEDERVIFEECRRTLVTLVMS